MMNPFRTLTEPFPNAGEVFPNAGKVRKLPINRGASVSVIHMFSGFQPINVSEDQQQQQHLSTATATAT